MARNRRSSHYNLELMELGGVRSVVTDDSLKIQPLNIRKGHTLGLSDGKWKIPFALLCVGRNQPTNLPVTTCRVPGLLHRLAGLHRARNNE